MANTITSSVDAIAEGSAGSADISAITFDHRLYSASLQAAGMALLGKESAVTMVEEANLDPDRLARLKSELVAIELWDSQYYHAKVHDQRDDDSLRAREKRREEIFDEILGNLGADPRAFRLSFRKVN